MTTPPTTPRHLGTPLAGGAAAFPVGREEDAQSVDLYVEGEGARDDVSVDCAVARVARGVLGADDDAVSVDAAVDRSKDKQSSSGMGKALDFQFTGSGGRNHQSTIDNQDLSDKFHTFRELVIQNLMSELDLAEDRDAIAEPGVFGEDMIAPESGILGEGAAQSLEGDDPLAEEQIDAGQTPPLPSGGPSLEEMMGALQGGQNITKDIKGFSFNFATGEVVITYKDSAGKLQTFRKEITSIIETKTPDGKDSPMLDAMREFRSAFKKTRFNLETPDFLGSVGIRHTLGDNLSSSLRGHVKDMSSNSVKLADQFLENLIEETVPRESNTASDGQIIQQNKNQILQQSLQNFQMLLTMKKAKEAALDHCLQALQDKENSLKKEQNEKGTDRAEIQKKIKSCQNSQKELAQQKEKISDTYTSANLHLLLFAIVGRCVKKQIHSENPDRQFAHVNDDTWLANRVGTALQKTMKEAKLTTESDKAVIYETAALVMGGDNSSGRFTSGERQDFLAQNGIHSLVNLNEFSDALDHVQTPDSIYPWIEQSNGIKEALALLPQKSQDEIKDAVEPILVTGHEAIDDIPSEYLEDRDAVLKGIQEKLSMLHPETKTASIFQRIFG